MHTHAPKQQQPQQRKSGDLARPRALLTRSHQARTILPLQNIIGNQAVQRSPHAVHKHLEGGSGGSGIPPTVSVPGDVFEQEADRVADKVIGMPEHWLQRGCACGGGCPKCQSQREQPSQNTERLLTRHAREKDADVRKAHPALNEAVGSPGQPLDAGTRAFMEPRFGHDFSRVRVHHDVSAAQSADAVNARAYVVGHDIVFGRGEYAPGTAQGRSLIAHELAHVVQQRNWTSPHPALQRAAKTVKTSAGEFVADPYDANVQIGAGDIIVGYGADITIKFKANERVDAEKIAFVQTAVGMKDDKVSSKGSGARMIPQDEAGEGTHIDQNPNARMPLYGMEGNEMGGKRGDELANPKSMKLKTEPLTKIGWHYKDASKKLTESEAMMHDEPFLTTGDPDTAAAKVMKGEWHQHFETTALAIAGNQKGTFYGSVEWGWTKSVKDLYPKLLEFKSKSENVPSPIFMEAAKQWNASVTTDKRDSIDLPVDVHVTSESAQLWDSPDQRKKIATLTQGTPLGRIAKVDPKGRIWWTSVIVTGGPNVGKTGWVMEVFLE